MPDTGRLAISITHGDGRVTRLGADEVQPENVPTGLGFSTTMPGGFGTCSLQLLQRIDLETPLELFDRVTAYGPGGEVAFDGYLTQLPRSHGDSFGLSPGAVGYSATLKDDPSFRQIYVDRDTSRWSQATLARRRAVATAGAPQGKIPATVGPGGIVWTPPNESLPTNERSEVMYDAGPGVKVARMEYRGRRNGAFTNFEAATVFTGPDAALSSVSTEVITLDNTIRTATSFTDNRYLMLAAATNATVTPAAGHEQSYDLIAVYGDHGMPIASVSGDASGITASNVITHIVGSAAPQLSYSITPSTFPIPHLIFPEPTTPEDAILFVNAYHQYEWGVYDNKTFFWRPSDPDRLCWDARLSDGAHLELEGLQAADTVNGVFVSYTDPTGVRKTVGPPGATADATSSSLADTSPDNPVNSHGIVRKWAKMDISQVTTDAGAVQLGAIWLAEQAIPQRRGTVTVKGTIQHPTQGQRPTWAVRAGDYVRISDHPADVPRRIISTDYRHDSREIRMDVGTTPNKLTAILERLNVASVGRY